MSILVLIVILVISREKGCGTPTLLTPSNCPPLVFRKGKVKVGRYRSIWKLDQNVRSIKGQGIYFGFYLQLKFKTKIKIIVLIGNGDFI